jgi:CubicO group peptidase (beta-lactamase class C family)
MKGLQSQNILCTAKHFPGHGDTDVDSHYDLPVINRREDRLRDIELYPFKSLINSGLSGIMTAHLNIPSLEPQQGLASTFSEQIIYKLLREQLGFRGLVFTDAMEMKGAIKNFPKGESMVRAILAGNDILETFTDVPEAVAAIRKAVEDGRIPISLLDEKVKKILKAKSWVGLDQYKPIEIHHLVRDLNTVGSDYINRELKEASVTCLHNSLNLLPVINLNQKIAVLTIDAENPETLVTMVKNYVSADIYQIHSGTSQENIDNILDSLTSYDLVLASIHWTKPRASSNYGISPVNAGVIRELAQRDNVILSLLGNPYAIHKLPELQNAQSLIVAYQCDDYTESIVPQIIFGALPAKGLFPVDLNDRFTSGMGIQWSSIDRLSYGVPEQVGMDREPLWSGLDSIINDGLIRRAYPGAVLQVSRKGKVIFQKAYGNHIYSDTLVTDATYQNTQLSSSYIDDAMDNDIVTDSDKPFQKKNRINESNVDIHDVYDLASLTKILGSTLAILTWMDEGKIKPDSPLSDYIPEWKGTDKEGITFRDAMTHRSGLKAWIPFWKNAVDTAATLKNALENYPSLKDELIYKTIKPGFFKRIFGARTKKEIDLKLTLAEKPELWNKILKPDTKVWKKHIFSDKKSDDFPVYIANHLWMHKNYTDSLYHQIARSPMGEYGQYVYSDLHYYLYPRLSENITGKPFDNYLTSIYQTIGAASLTFNPDKTADKWTIVPTEFDTLFRGQLLHGQVHDEGAALMGGISGHAGLFGNANDVMKIMQMYLQKGHYGGERYISESLVEKSTQYQFPEEKNRRGMGFDKKDFNESVTNAPSLSSDSGYGHSGFTGTYTWVDPELDLVYVFLTNRVFPTRKNRILIEQNIRQKIGDHIIQSIRQN